MEDQRQLGYFIPRPYWSEISLQHNPPVLPSRRPTTNCENDMGHRWSDMARVVDQKFAAAEERMRSESRELQAGLARRMSARMNTVLTDIEADMERKVNSLVEKKMKEVENQMCKMVGENLNLMERKLRRVEMRVSEEEQEGASELVATGHTQQLGEATRDDSERLACSFVKMKLEEMGTKVAALESSVGKAVYHLLPKVNALFEKLDSDTSKAIADDHCKMSLLAAAGFRLPPCSPYRVSDPSISRLDKDLLMAAHRGEQESVKELLKQEAEVNVDDGAGYTPLHLAAKKGHTAVVEILLNGGADVNGGQEGGITPLHWAVMQSNSGCVNALIRGGADIERRTRNDWTALHFACAMSSKYIVKLLLWAGADHTVRNACGKTPLNLTTSEGIRKVFHAIECEFAHCPSSSDGVE